MYIYSRFYNGYLSNWRLTTLNTLFVTFHILVSLRLNRFSQSLLGKGGRPPIEFFDRLSSSLNIYFVGTTGSVNDFRGLFKIKPAKGQSGLHYKDVRCGVKFELETIEVKLPHQLLHRNQLRNHNYLSLFST